MKLILKKILILVIVCVTILAITSAQKTTAQPKKNGKGKKDKVKHPIYHNCDCQNVTGKRNFDSSKFTKKWYLIKQLNAIPMYPFTGDCAQATFSMTNKKKGTLSTKSVFSNSIIKTVNTKLAYTGNGVFQWSLGNMTVDKNEVPVNSNLTFAVMHTDYNKIAIILICGNYSLGGIPNPQPIPDSLNANQKYIPPFAFLIMSRDKKFTLESKKLDKIKNETLSDLTCQNRGQYADIKQDDVTCKILQ